MPLRATEYDFRLDFDDGIDWDRSVPTFVDHFVYTYAGTVSEQLWDATEMIALKEYEIIVSLDPNQYGSPHLGYHYTQLLLQHGYALSRINHETTGNTDNIESLWFVEVEDDIDFNANTLVSNEEQQERLEEINFMLGSEVFVGDSR